MLEAKLGLRSLIPWIVSVAAAKTNQLTTNSSFSFRFVARSLSLFFKLFSSTVSVLLFLSYKKDRF